MVAVLPSKVLAINHNETKETDISVYVCAILLETVNENSSQSDVVDGIVKTGSSCYW